MYSDAAAVNTQGKRSDEPWKQMGERVLGLSFPSTEYSIAKCERTASKLERKSGLSREFAIGPKPRVTRAIGSGV
jgi:RecB family exonuclease